MVVNGVLYAVVRMANTQEGEAVREVCARAVYNLSTEPRFHGLLAENGGSQMLIRVSRASQTVALQRTVVQALQNLAHAPQWHEKMLEDAPEGEGLLAGLKHLGRFMDVEVRVRVGQILLNLSAHEETRQTLITPDNAILPLLMLLVRTDSEELQFLGCAALCNVSTVVPLHKEMVVGGVLQAMVKVIRRAPLASTAAPAVKCIYNLIAQTLPVSEAVVEAEGVYVLVALAQESRAEETVRTAVKCLAVICSADGMEDRAVEGGAALGLAVGVAYVTTRVLLDRLMYALCRLTADRGRHRQVVQHGALDVVVNLSMPQDLALGDNFVHNCTAALRNLSTSPGFVHEQLFACPGAVPAALKFADAEDPRARANVAVFLHNLAKDDEKAQRAIVKRGGIGRLIELAEREGGAGDVRVVCAITLQALSKYSALDAGGFDPQRFLGGVVTMLQADGAQVARVVNEVTRDCVPGDAPLERGQASYFEGLVGLGDAVWFPHREPEWPYFTEENKGNESLGQDRIRPQDGKMEPIKPRALQTDDGDLIVGAFRPIELPTQKRDVGPLVVEGGQPSLPPSQDHSRRSSGATSVSFRGARALLGDGGGGRPAAAGEDGVFPEDSLEGQLSAMTVEMPEVPPPDSQAAMMEEGSKPLLLSKTAPHRL
uniref:Vacuolar protein 8 n=1 Tax=Heterosigma akashiwo TaxID=2829 RepID=A0A7S3XVW5_HETAK